MNANNWAASPFSEGSLWASPRAFSATDITPVRPEKLSPFSENWAGAMRQNQFKLKTKLPLVYSSTASQTLFQGSIISKDPIPFGLFFRNFVFWIFFSSVI